LACSLIVALVTLLLFSGLTTVRAASVTFDFSISDQGWFGFHDTGIGQGSDPTWNGSEWVGTSYTSFGGGYRTSIEYCFPSAVSIDYATVNHTNSGSTLFVGVLSVDDNHLYTLPNNSGIQTAISSPANSSQCWQVYVDAQFASAIQVVTFDGPSFPSTGTPTVTPTVTSTPFAPPELGGTLGKVCGLLGLSSSTFTFLDDHSKWDIYGDVLPTNPPGHTQGMLISNGQATLSIPLDSSRQYSIYVAWHLTTTSGVDFPDHFTVKLGQSPPIDIDIPESTSVESYTVPDSVYTPTDTAGGSSFYDLTISKSPNEGSDPGLVIDFVCVSQVTTDATGASTTPKILQAVCKQCEYRPKGDLIADIGALIAWILCGISQLWDCVAKRIFTGIWQTIADIMVFATAVRLWFSLVVARGATWINGNLTVLWNWASGTFTNLLTAIINAAGRFFRDFGLGDFFDTVLGFLVSLPNLVLTALTTLVNWVLNAIQISILVVRVVFDWLDSTFNTVLNLLGIIPELIGSIVTGFNASSDEIPTWALACNSANTMLYWPCLGMYVADNTFLQGPVYMLIPAVEGVVGIHVLLWAVREVREMISK